MSGRGPASRNAIARREAGRQTLSVLDLSRLSGRAAKTADNIKTAEGMIKEISDRVWFFYNGRIEEQGPPSHLFDAPHKERTQHFLSVVLEAH